MSTNTVEMDARGRTDKRVSVVIPAYNAAEFIGLTLRSVLGQSLSDFDVVVCDDCSRDGTENVVRSFDDPRIRYVRNERNLGPAGNFNACLDHATADIVCLFHADDVMTPDNLARKLAVLERHPNVGLVHSNARYIDPTGRELGFANPPGDEETVVPGAEAFVDWWEERHSVNAPSVVMRRSVVETVGRFENGITHTQDLNYWLRMALYADVAYLSAPLIEYRQHPGQDSNKYSPSKLIREDFMARELAMARAGARVQGAARMMAQARGKYAIRALNRAGARLHAGDVREARALLGLTARIQPRRCVTADYIRLAVKYLFARGK